MGTVMFNGLALVTAPGRVMTPRATSEQLVAAACTRVAGRPARVADIGTGSGAIAIAIAIACPNVEVWATDISRSAVALARANVRRHRLEDRVFVRHGDLLAPVPGPVDLIVANLPYVAASTAAQHPDLVSEPVAAVFAAGDAGVDERRTTWVGQSCVVSTDRPTLRPHSASRRGWQSGSKRGSFSRTWPRSHSSRMPPSAV